MKILDNVFSGYQPIDTGLEDFVNFSRRESITWHDKSSFLRI
jgi:hypothetical protein